MTRYGQQKIRRRKGFTLAAQKSLFFGGLLLGGILLGTSMSWGSSVKVTTLLDQDTTTINQPVGLRIHMEGTQERPSVEIPESSELYVLSRGTSTSVEIVNGVQKILQELYYLVIPQKEGLLEVPSLTLHFSSGTEVHTQKFKLRVGSPKPSQSNSSAKTGEKQGKTGNPQSREVFVSADLSRREVYTGEPLTYFFRFFQAVPAEERDFSPPDFGTLPQEVLQSREYSRKVDGITYKVTEVPFLLSPVKPGKTTIPKATLEVVLENQKALRGFLLSGGSLFSPSLEDLLNFGHPFGRPLKLETSPLSFDVLPLPAWKGSPSFSGLVGSADMKVLLQKDHAKTGEPLDMVVLLQGVGNMKDVQPPSLAAPSHCKIYQDAPEESLTPTLQGYEGIKAFHYTLVPLRASSRDFPPVQLTLFNPAKREYQVLEAPVPSFTVSGAPIAEASETHAAREEPTPPPDTKAPEEAKIAPETELLTDGRVSLEERLPPLSSRTVLVALLACPLGYGVVLLWQYWDLKRKAYSVRMMRESRKALKRAKRSLKAEERALALEKSLRKAVFAHMEREEKILEKEHFQELQEQNLLSEEESLQGQQALKKLHHLLYGNTPNPPDATTIEGELLPVIRRLWQ